MTKRKMKTNFLTSDDFEDTDLENMCACISDSSDLSDIVYDLIDENLRVILENNILRQIDGTYHQLRNELNWKINEKD